MSRRVKSLRLRRQVGRGWLPEMVGHGLVIYRQHRGTTISVVPQLRIQLTEWGVRGTVDLTALGRPVEDLAKLRKHLASKFRVPTCSVWEITSGIAGFEMRHSDPLDRPVTTADLPEPRRHLHVVTGLDESGRGVERDLVLPQLVVGAQGSGKSSEAWTLLWALQRAGIPCRVRAFDPKGGMELGELADAAYAYESDPAKWPEFLGGALGGLHKRQTDLAGRGVRKLTWFTDEQPLDLMLIDELIAILDIKADVKFAGRVMRADDAMRLYLSQGRAAGHTALALSQLGHADVIGRIRPLFSHATCMRVGAMEAAMVDVVLGSKDAHKLYPAHQIQPGQRFAGVGYTRLETAVRRYRAAYLTDEERAEVVERMRADTARFREARSRAREKAGAAA